MRRRVIINGIKFTPFLWAGLRRVVSRYGKTKYDVVIDFLPEESDSHGTHEFINNEKVKCHKIEIFTYAHLEASLNEGEFKLMLIDTLLHELRHAFQSEQWDNYSIDYERLDYKYSREEVDAVSYALRNTKKAVSLHDG